MGMCTGPCCKLRPLVDFIPLLKRSVRKHHAYRKCLTDPHRHAAEIAKLRQQLCIKCRTEATNSQKREGSKVQLCRAKLAELRKGKSCMVCGCDDALEFEHRDPATKKRDSNGVPVNLTNCTWWAYKGGPDAMEREAQLCDIMCRNCHMMQPTNLIFNRVSSDSLPRGSASHRQDPKQRVLYNRWRQAVQHEEKVRYVDGRKLAIGGCAVCQMRVITNIDDWWPAHNGLPHCFDFANLDDEIKGDRNDENGNIAKLVGRSGRTLASLKHHIDREMARSRLLCKCCHAVETKERNSAR